MSLTDALRLRVIKEVEMTIAVAGTPEVIPANLQAEAVRIINNNVSKTISVGRQATVDANSTPEVGIVLRQLESHIEFGLKNHVSNNFIEVWVDSDTNTTVITLQYMGA
jgi:hypothetical protein